MNTVNCLIIEDEPIASGILEDYVAQVPHLNLLGVHRNALGALNDLKEKEIDLIFLDIHLPVIKGLEFLRTLTHPPKVIMTTAYHQYAVESYELEALDYLLKPFSFDRFLKAVNKMSVPKTETVAAPVAESKPDYFFVNVAKRKVRVRFSEIQYVEGSKEYVKIFLDDNMVRTKMGLNQIEELLPQNDFIRSHRSFIVAKEKIRSYDHSFAEIGDQFIPIGKIYKELFLRQMD